MTEFRWVGGDRRGVPAGHSLASPLRSHGLSPTTRLRMPTRNKSPLHLTRDGITIPGKLSKPGYENIPIASRLGPYPVLVVRRDTKEQVGSLHGMMDYDASKREW